MRNKEILLDTAVQQLIAAKPEHSELTAAALRIADQIGLSGSEAIAGAIDGCEDVQRMLPAYRAGALPQGRSLLVRAHLRDCGECHRSFAAGAGTAAVDWSRPLASPTASRLFAWNPRALGWAVSSAIALLAVSFFLYRTYWEVPPGVRAEVRSIEGPVYRVSDTEDRRLAPGDVLNEGEQLRTSGGGHAVLHLADGSIVEVHERSVLDVGARGRNMTVALHGGAVIVQAAKRSAGHLYVQTPDCRVAVTGTVFSVNSGLKGSRVAVLEGSLHVLHAGTDEVVRAGDQVSTNNTLSPEPVSQQISWSEDRGKYLQLIAQFSALERRLEQIPAPQLRYTSDLLGRVPTNTLFYISMPNFGDFLGEANTIFHEQLAQSSVLQQWWGRGKEANAEQLDATVERLHTMSRYLGNEVVVIGLEQSADPGFAVLADVQKAGLGDFLSEQFHTTGNSMTLLDEQALNAAAPSPDAKQTAYALVREHEAVFSNSIATLKQVNAQLNAGSSGFASGDFGQHIAEAYSRGAGIILAADLHQMILARNLTTTHPKLETSGMDGLRYLVAEHREQNGLPQNHLNLQFSGTRERVASWLAAPASMESLGFVTPNAAVAVAVLSKDPSAIADDILSMATQDKASSADDLNAAQSRLKISLRDDLAANLGGEFLFSLDGAVLPTPAWKAVIEVRDAVALERTLETLAGSTCQLQQGKRVHCVAIQASQSGSQRIFSVVDQTSGLTVAAYTFADGYLILTPDRALLMKALHAHTSGDSLARSAAFKATLPRDENENYSAVAYQNAGPSLAPLLSQVTGPTAVAIQQLTADARPTAICAWGQDTSIEAASQSRLFGFDFLALKALINPENKNPENKNPGNKHESKNVTP